MTTQAEMTARRDGVVRIVAAERPATVRGVYYRAVSAGLVEKSKPAYRRILRDVRELRRAGVIDYGAIVDTSRVTHRRYGWANPGSALHGIAATYRRQLWPGLPTRVHILTEKDTLTVAVQPITDEWQVPLSVCRGYNSDTLDYGLAEEWSEVHERDDAHPTTMVYQLGDHDPSGLNAWATVQAKVREHIADRGVDPDDVVRFERLAVTPEQIADHGLLMRPTKSEDPRADGFEGESVEVDALPVPVLQQLVTDAIRRWLPREHVDAVQAQERDDREFLRTVARDRR